ncbi:hypothetical protein BH09ACT8_BH09ACT8_20890 [soil metagenome]
MFELGDPPPDVVALSEEDLTAQMAALIREAPRTWKEILQHFIGQPYRTIYGAFSNLRHQLGRCDDEPWYRHTFSDTDFAVKASETEPSNFDPRHRDTGTEGPQVRRAGSADCGMAIDRPQLTIDSTTAPQIAVHQNCSICRPQ